MSCERLEMTVIDGRPILRHDLRAMPHPDPERPATDNDAGGGEESIRHTTACKPEPILFRLARPRSVGADAVRETSRAPARLCALTTAAERGRQAGLRNRRAARDQGGRRSGY
jgi:hypothetical protein